MFCCASLTQTSKKDRIKMDRYLLHTPIFFHFIESVPYLLPILYVKQS